MLFVSRELMYHLPSACAALLVSACPQVLGPEVRTAGRPSRAEIERLERTIARTADPCIGPLDALVRSYRFLVREGRADHRYIEITFFKPGEVSRSAGRYADLVELGFVVDGPTAVANGIFNRKQEVIEDWLCGTSRWRRNGEQFERIQGKSFPLD